MMLRRRRPHLRVVEPIDESPDYWPELPSLREVCARIARAAVITVATIMACAYVLFGASLAYQLYRTPDPLNACVTVLMFALVLFVGIKVLRSLRQRPSDDVGPAVVEHHHHHYQ